MVQARPCQPEPWATTTRGGPVTGPGEWPGESRRGRAAQGEPSRSAARRAHWRLRCAPERNQADGAAGTRVGNRAFGTRPRGSFQALAAAFGSGTRATVPTAAAGTRGFTSLRPCSSALPISAPSQPGDADITLDQNRAHRPRLCQARRLDRSGRVGALDPGCVRRAESMTASCRSPPRLSMTCPLACQSEQGAAENAARFF